MDHVHHKKDISVWYGMGWIIGPGGGSRHGTGRDATGAIGTALVIIGRDASLSISGGLSLLLLVSVDMLPLLLVLMDHELDRLKGEGRRPIG